MNLARKYGEQLLAQLAWRQDELFMYGKKVLVPRLQAFYGAQGLSYQYSGLRLTASPWLPLLLTCKALVEQKTQSSFNAVLANCYRDQQDTVSWHSDDEVELGLEPVIASLSFGAERHFQLKHKVTGEKLTVPLKAGSLLVMSGQTQAYWSHCLPRTKVIKSPRINLTFRQIYYV